MGWTSIARAYGARVVEREEEGEEEEEEGEGEMEMEPSIWGRLPDEILERVLALLPLRTLVSLRPTCRRFRSLLLTPSFLSLRLPYQPTSSFLLFSHPQFPPNLLPLYDPSSDSWRRAHLSPSSSSSSSSLSSHEPRLLCSSSGLLCFSLNPSSSSSSSSLLVHNPLSNSTRLLPPFPSPAGASAVALSSATLVSPRLPRPHGYKLFVPSSQNPSWVFLYDSETRSWSRFPGFEPLLARSGAPNLEGAHFRGALLFATPEPPCSVVAFDLSSGAWAPPGAPAPPPLPAGLAFARLVGAGAGAGERLFLVGGVGRDGITRSVGVWELVASGGGGGVDGGWRWEEVGRLPEMMCRKLVGVCYHNYAHVYCTWHAGAGGGAAQGAVCVCCATWPEVLLYRVGRATWHWLPRCPLLRDKWSCGFRWFSFTPDLFALV